MAVQVDPMTIEQTYNHFLSLTGEPAAAATLTLAAVRSEEKQDRSVLTPPEIAEQIGVAPETVIAWIRSGQLKASNLATGRRPRYVVKPEHLDAFLALRQPQRPTSRSQKPKTLQRSYRRFSE